MKDGDVKYAPTEKEWALVAKACIGAGTVGLDTETYGHDVRETTAPYRAKVHVWSLAIFDGRPGGGNSKSSGGTRTATGVCLPAAALRSSAIRELLERPDVLKVAHNAPHDLHAIANHGTNVANCVDSLPRARLVYSDHNQFGLKYLSKAILGRVLSEYKDVLSVPNWVDSTKRVRVCVCGDSDCRKRGKEHRREDRTYTDRILRGTKLVPLEEVQPGHPLWPGLVRYAIEDAVAALELWDRMENTMVPPPPDAKWFPFAPSTDSR